MRKQVVSLLAALTLASALPGEARLPKRIALRTVKWCICVPVYFAGTGVAIVGAGAYLFVTAAGAGVAIVLTML